MTHLWIGTSGWIYKHWQGIFYPPDLPAREHLAFYAAQFPTVEVNYSFYRLPERPIFEAWRAQTPKRFLFAVKGSRFLTHMKKLKDPEEPLARLMERASGLEEKLGPLLFQFPRPGRLTFPALRRFWRPWRRMLRSASRWSFGTRTGSHRPSSRCSNAPALHSAYL